MNVQKLTLLVSALFLTGCSSLQTPAPRTAFIGHIVFVELVDHNDYDEILADCDSMLATIPSVMSYAAGHHIDTGRETVINDYDLAIYLGFDSQYDLDAYVAHEQHIALVTKWKSRMSALRVYDMHDPTR